jgi:hypothetical protein
MKVKFYVQTVQEKYRKKAAKYVMSEQLASHWAGTVSAGSKNFFSRKFFKILQ